MRDDPTANKRGRITPEQGKQKAESIGAVGYVECSAMKNEGVKEVFDTAIRIATTPQKEGCTCLLL